MGMRIQVDGATTLICRTAVALCALACLTREATAQAPHSTTNPPRLTRFYADPGTPDISGVWRSVRDNYRPRFISDFQRLAGSVPSGPSDGGGLAPGVLPRDFWIVDGKPLPGRSPGGPWIGIPYTPAWQVAYDKRVADNRAGMVYGDPHFECLPRGAMASYHGGNNTFAITQTPGRVQQNFEEQSQLREIYTDGRKHASWADVNSDDYDPTPFGDSIGHWEGKTLVVDTTGVRREYTTGNLGMHSGVFHFVERITRIDPTHLDVDITVDDKAALLKPMSMKVRYVSQPNADLKEEICENGRIETDDNGYVHVLVKPKKTQGWDLPNDP